MCIFMEEEDDESGGGARLQTKQHHHWLVPRRGMYVLLALSIIAAFLGAVLMAIGGGLASTA